jgi:hypothetical protein
MRTTNTLALDQNLDRLGLFFAIERATLHRLGGWLAGIVYWDAKLAVGTLLTATRRRAECPAE